MAKPGKQCNRVHTPIQPKFSEYKCPKCYSVNFVQQENDPFCDLLHPDDTLSCCRCGFITSGAIFEECIAIIRDDEKRKEAAKLANERGETCPCCNGTGKVTKDGLEDWLEKLRKQFKERFP